MRCKWQKWKVIVLVAFCIVFCKTTAEAAEILPTNVTKPSSGCIFVGLEGAFVEDADVALNRINEIRLEACREGVKNPANGKPLTEKDYVPIKWSYDLQYISRIRAAEASVNISHTRLNGERCFTVKSPNGKQSYGEVLAWNWQEEIVYGINQWYGEKELWIGGCDDLAQVGHYAQMINPNNTYIGMASFYSEKTKYRYSVCGEFSSDKSMSEEKMPVAKDCIQMIEVLLDDVNFAIFLQEKDLKIGETAVYNVVMDIPCGKEKNKVVSVVDVNGIKWNSSDTSVATIDENGTITAKGFGTTKITAVSKTNEKLNAWQMFTPYFPDIAINKTNFPGLYKVLTSKDYDLNKDGYLSFEECEALQWLQTEKAVSTLKGIEYFPYLNNIYIANYTGTTLTIPKNKKVNTLWVDSKKSKLIVNAPKLQSLNVMKFSLVEENGKMHPAAGNSIASKKLKNLDVSKCKELHDLGVIQDKITTLKLPKKKNNKLRWICLEKMDVKTVQFKECPNLAYIRMADMAKLKSMDLTKNPKILALELYRNKNLTKINASKCKKIKEIYLYYPNKNLKKNIKLPKGKKVKYPKNNRSITKIGNKILYELNK